MGWLLDSVLRFCGDLRSVFTLGRGAMGIFNLLRFNVSSNDCGVL